MHAALQHRFATHYRGRHEPADALWWLDHPDAPGPSGARPPQIVILEAVDALEADGRDHVARSLLEALAELLSADRAAALAALECARADVDRTI